MKNLINCCLQFLKKSFVSQDKIEGMTSETPFNSYTPASSLTKFPHGRRIDYIMCCSKDNLKVDTIDCYNPLPSRVEGRGFSYSDHEAVCSVLRITPNLIQGQQDLVREVEPTREVLKELLNVFEGGRVGSLVAALDDWQKTLEKNAEADACWRIMLLLTMSRWCARPQLAAGQACVDAWRLLETAIPPRVGMEAAWLREHLPEGRAILPII